MFLYCILAEILPTSKLFISLESSLNEQYFGIKINTLNKNLGELQFSVTVKLIKN